MHRGDDVDFDSVGVAFDAGIEMRIEAPDPNGVGEVVTRHPNMFLGYYKNPDATAADLRDGWMHTGDAGYFNAAGHLVVIDRIQDLATTARGTRFSPQYIENKLKFSALYRRGGDPRRGPRLSRGDDLHPAFRSSRAGPRRSASPSPPTPTWRRGRRSTT